MTARATDTFDAWRAMLSTQAMPVHVRSDDAAAFTGRMHAADFGVFRTVITENRRVEVERTRALIRRSDPEIFYLVLNFQGEQEVSSDRRAVALSPGDVVLLHSSRPSRTRADPRLRDQVGSVVTVDPSVLPFDGNRLSTLLGTRMAATDSVNSLVSRYLYMLATEAPRLAPADAVRLSTVTLDLIAMMFARQFGLVAGVPPETRDSARFAQIQSYALARLGDPTLTPESIAAAHHISVRTLHRLFQAHAMTVAGWIRHARLERCRRDLVDPGLTRRSVASIGGRWGFPSAAQLSRAFKRTYGLSPQAFRDGP
jgi:AraC-like DNA-binding protein